MLLLANLTLANVGEEALAIGPLLWKLAQQSPPPVQLLLCFATWLACWVPLAWWIGRRIGWQFPSPPEPAQKLPLVLSLYLLAPLPLWGYGQLQGWGLGAQLAASGWRWDWPFAQQVGLGLGIALLGLGLLWGLELALGWLRFNLAVKPQLVAVALPILLLALLVSAVEETLFRGVLPVSLGAGLGAIALSNAAFALLHLPWEPLKTGLPQLPGLWLMGLVLALAVGLSGNLALAIGLHGGWVWAIASLDTTDGLTYSGQVPAWVTGLNGNLVAGAMGIAFLAVTGLGVGLKIGLGG